MARLTLFQKFVRLPLRILPIPEIVTFYWGALKGFKWITKSSNASYWLGFYEAKMKSYLIKSVKENQVFLDLGAHVGYYTILASKLVGKNGRVYSFEPLPRNLSFLNKHIALNSLQNVTVYSSAVGHEEGYFTMNISSPVAAKLDANGTFEVKVLDLVQLIEKREIEFPDVIKMDIEGEESYLLPKILKISQDKNIHIFLSTHGREVHTKLIDLLIDEKFSLVPLDGNELASCTEVYCYRKR